MTAIKKNLGNFAAIIGLIVIAAGVSLYILDQQRLRFPFFEPKPYQLKAEFSTAQAVVAGQGQTVRVVGRAHRRHRRRRAQGRPRRDQDGHRPGVQGPGPHERDRAAAAQDRPEGHVHRPRSRAAATRRWPSRASRSRSARRSPTSTPTRCSRCSTPTRASTCSCWSTALGRGLEGRGGDLRDLFARFEPTHRDLARVNGAVATRRKQLRHLVTSLNVLSKRARVARRRPRRARRLVLRRVRLVRQGAGQRLLRRRRAAEHAAADHRHARARRDVRRAARADDREAAPGGARARPRQRGGAPVRPRGDAAAAQEHPPVRARVAPARARPAPGLGAARQGRPGPDAGVPALQPLPQPARLQPERQGGPGQRGPPGGLPVLAGVAEPLGDPAVLELRRPRHAPPGHDRRAVRDARAGAAGAARARVHLGADAAADRLEGVQRRHRRRQPAGAARAPRAPDPVKARRSKG